MDYLKFTFWWAKQILLEIWTLCVVIDHIFEQYYLTYVLFTKEGSEIKTEGMLNIQYRLIFRWKQIQIFSWGLYVIAV